MITAVVFEPGQKPVLKDVDSSLASMQKLVGGLVQQRPLFDVLDSPNLYLLCNEEGKLVDDCKANCALVHRQTGGLADLIYGTFLVVNVKSSDWASLTPIQQEMVLASYGSSILPVQSY